MLMKEWNFGYRRMSKFFIENNIKSIRGYPLTPSMCWSIIKKKEMRDSKFFSKNIVDIKNVRVTYEDYIPHIHGPLV